jgi:hypothetical protein
VTLVGINGLITLGSTSGLSFLAGDGTVDASMTFDGSLADINNALAGLRFSPTPGYHGAASLQIITNDQGSPAPVASRPIPISSRSMSSNPIRVSSASAPAHPMAATKAATPSPSPSISAARWMSIPLAACRP